MFSTLYISMKFSLVVMILIHNYFIIIFLIETNIYFMLCIVDIMLLYNFSLFICKYLL